MGARPVFNYEGTKYHVGSLKVREVEDLERALDCRYVEIAPLGNMRHKVAMMVTFLGRTRSDAEVTSIIENLELDAVDEMWTVEDDDMPDSYEDGIPKAAGEPSTPTS